MNNPGSTPLACPIPKLGIAQQAEGLARGIDVILTNLLQLVIAGFRHLGPHARPVWTRISRARRRLAILLANLAAGRLPRPRAPRPGRRGGAPAPYIPRSRAWLVVALGYNAAGYASQLDVLLRDPATPAILAASPGAARTINRLCQLLGVTPPTPAAPTPRAAPAPRPSSAETHPPLQPAPSPATTPGTAPNPPAPKIGTA
ncbi:MAG: hypothetical protein IT555_12900 [Acetobacteraceae bacterium]|nr:hypothetical protein [Acetobacteraceae bacterium]